MSAVAKQATVSPDGQEVELRGDVVVERAARPGQSAMTLRTAQLLVFPERDQVRDQARLLRNKWVARSPAMDCATS